MRYYTCIQTGNYQRLSSCDVAGPLQALDHLLETRLKDETRACEVTIREGSHQGPIVVTTSFMGRNALPAPSSSHSVNFAAYDIGKRVPLPTYKTATMEK